MKNDSIDLILPLEEIYAQVLRLTMEGIARCLDFTWLQIEDMKAACQEVFILAIKVKSEERVHFNFVVEPEALTINVINVYLGSFRKKMNKMDHSSLIISSSVDKLEVTPRKVNYFDLKLVKNLF